VDVLDSSPSILLHHDGELEDVRRLLEESGVAFAQRIGTPPRPDRRTGWDLVIATPRRILHVQPSKGGPKPMLISVLDGDSRTLRAHLRRVAVDIIVRRPVHPTALRLLILHAIYRGPERRDRERVTIGSEVRFRSGLLPRQATLTELSIRGCRLLSQRPAQRDKSVKLYVPARVTGSKPLSLTGTVLRCGPAPSELPGVFVMGIRFDRTNPIRLRLLSDTLKKHRQGPAVLSRPASPDPSAHGASHDPTLDPAAFAGTKAGAVTEIQAEAPPEPAPERRDVDRHSYEKHVVALGPEATRVLIGRDISEGGMRVDPSCGLALGDSLQLAIHASARDEPLVVQADVVRDDGDSGMILRFEELDEVQRRELSRIITHLPLLATNEAEGTEDGIVVTEILERRTG